MWRKTSVSWMSTTRRLGCAAAKPDVRISPLSTTNATTEESFSQKLLKFSSAFKTSDGGAEATAAVWKRLEECAATAIGLREVDAFLAVAHDALRHAKKSPKPETWIELFRAAAWSDVELRSVDAYADALRSTSSDSTRKKGSLNQRSVVDRSVLVMTGGVIPHTMRFHCASGWAFVELLKRWEALRPTPETLLTEGEANIIIQGLNDNRRTVEGEAVAEISSLLIRCSASTEVDSILFQLLERMDIPTHSESPSSVVSGRAGKECRGIFGAVAISRTFTSYKSITTFLALERVYRVLNVFRKTYGVSTPGVLAEVHRLSENLELALQQNEHDNNPLGLDDVTVSLVRRTVREARIRAERVDAVDPIMHAAQIREKEKNGSLEVTFWVDYELIRLYECGLRAARELSLTSSDEQDSELDPLSVSLESRDPLLSDMIDVLIHMVQVRPRGDDMDPEAKALYQHAHAVVIETLCSTRAEHWISKAYLIVVTHKYHNLSVDTELVRPLLVALSRRGDCRVFNLVDLITLYCGNKVDFETMECLFRACRVAGDAHRAKALYVLLRDVVPGFLSKAPPSIEEHLRGLKILPPIPGHMFAAVDDTERAAVVELPTKPRQTVASK